MSLSISSSFVAANADRSVLQNRHLSATPLMVSPHAGQAFISGCGGSCETIGNILLSLRIERVVHRGRDPAGFTKYAGKTRHDAGSHNPSRHESGGRFTYSSTARSRHVLPHVGGE